MASDVKATILFLKYTRFLNNFFSGIFLLYSIVSEERSISVVV